MAINAQVVRGSAVADQASTAEEQAVTVNVLGNDVAGDSGLILLGGVTRFPRNGEIRIDQNRQVIYTPDENFNGTDSFTYQTIDGFGNSSTATVTVTVTPVNDAPTATDDTASINEEGTATVAVLRNDTDIDRDTLSVVGVTGAQNGTAAFDQNGNVTYTPDEDFTGTDTITYTVSDGNGGTDTGTLTVTVRPVNDLPTAAADTATTNEDTATTLDVLANDSDVESDTVEIVRLGRPRQGTVVQNDDGTLTYTPNADFNGTDSFTYQIRDADGATATGTATVTVTSVNDAPTAVDDRASISEEGTATVAVLRNDTDTERDTLSVVGVTGAQNGSASVDAEGNVVYVAGDDFVGTETLTYTVSDGNGGTDTGTLTVEVRGVNDLPTAAADTATTNEDTATTLDVLANDSDVESTTLAVTRLGRPQNGTVRLNGDGTVTYTPNADFAGTDSFTYQLQDEDGGRSQGTVNVTVTQVNDAPDAQDDRARTNEDSPVTIAVLGNDEDTENDTLTVTIGQAPTSGDVAVNGDGTVTYTPDANFAGTDTFTYSVSDGNGGTDTATVTVDVAGVNDAPEVDDTSVTTNEDTPLTVELAPLASDLDQDTLRFAIADRPDNGSVRIDSRTGTVTYTPTADFSGSDSFVFTVSDGRGGTGQGTVNIGVTAVNDAPVATDDSITGIEDSSFTINVLTNDRDTENDQLTVNLDSAQAPTLGTVQVTPDGRAFVYTANPNASGTDTFGYVVRDSSGATDTATVTVRLTPTNDAPVAVGDSATTTAGTPVSIAVLTNDTDADNDALSVASLTDPAGGRARISGGNILYTPDTDFTGTDVFNYTVTDRKGGSATATVTVTVQDGTTSVAVAAHAADPFHADSFL